MVALAGIFDLHGQQRLPPGALQRMTEALAHRGPAGGMIEEPGLGLAWRRRHAAPPRETIPGNEDGTIVAACQGVFTNEHDLRSHLTSRRHQLRSAHAAEILVHLWEDDGAALLARLRGQFALAIWDRRQRSLLLGRDRIGMAPLYWAQRGPWLLFASEIKGLLASGLVPAEVDRRGVDHVMTFMGLPAARTCFRDVQALLPGHGLLAQGGNVQVRRYWDLDFPERGQEEKTRGVEQATEELQDLLQRAVTRRLPGDEPVASYISGGIDCSTLTALAGKSLQRPVPTFTARIDSPRLDESDRAVRIGRSLGFDPKVESFDPGRILDTFPRLIRAAECPTPDGSCGALLLLAERVQAEGVRVVLAGDGADDLFAGYPWFKTNRLLGLLDVVPGFRFGLALRRLILRWTAPHITAAMVRRTQALIGGHNAWLDLYGLISLNRSRFYSAGMREALAGHIAYEDLVLDLGRMRRWHPLNQALYLGMKTHVPGLLLQAKGERIAMHSGVELRYPYLDEDVVAFSTRLHPRWKLRRLRDKYLLRRVAERWLPRDIAWRPKRDFVAPFDSLYRPPAPRWVEELLSEASLRRAGYFDPTAVRHWRGHYGKLARIGSRRFSVEIGLASVVATQLWHHLYIDGNLADLPSRC
jgi:asparagine synthase (glutamine-hydrolysing)